MDLQSVTQVVPDAILDIRYATRNNFTHKQLYDKAAAYLRSDVLEALGRAADELRQQGYKLVIFDAYRPHEVQQKMHELYTDTNYVTVISNHTRGITVDLTLATKDGLYLDMGTEYDDFSEKAHAGTGEISRKQAANRELLLKAMTAVGFAQHPYEWWHFDFTEGLDWPVITSSEVVHDKINQ